MTAVELDLGASLIAALQLSVALVFLSAALTKLRRPAAFARTVSEYRVLPSSTSGAVAWAVIALEVVVAASLLSGLVLPLGIALAGLGVLTFSAAVGLNLRRGARVPCGCFGSLQERISGRTVARLLLLLLAILVLAGSTAAGVDPVSAGTGGVPVSDYLLGIGGTAIALVIASAWLLQLPQLLRFMHSGRRRRKSAPDVNGTNERQSEHLEVFVSEGRGGN